MTTPKWGPGALKLPGDLVQPRTVQPTQSAAITNAGFESGDAAGWTLGGSASITTDNPYSGTYALEFNGTGGEVEAVHDSVLVSPGKSITASCMYQQGGASSGQNIGHVFLRWLDVDGETIKDSDGSVISSTTGDSYKQSTVTAVAPARTVSVEIGIKINRDASEASRADNFTWNYAIAPAPAGLIYRAVQDGPGTTAATEPTWPAVLGEQVIDGGVIWEAVLASRVTWKASSILKSGEVEPNWSTSVGGFVADGSISWECISRRVEDPKCPNTKVVIILASKVFAVDGDIIRFSATANPLDWSSEQDAGYLPSGLQSANANDMAVLAQYRTNLAALNASTFQNWQADPDPSVMAILDQIEGIGSTWYRAAQPVANELIFLSQQGFRSVGIAAGAENLAAGDVGEPVDELVQAAMTAIGPMGKVISTYYPGAGQFWGCFPFADANESWVYVYTMSGKKGKWSRYHFPFAIECFAQLGNVLYIRSGNTIRHIDKDAVNDEVDGVPVPFTGTVWWPHLDFDSPGVTKMLETIDYIGTGQGPSIQIGYDQRNVNTLTPAYQLDNDTLPGGSIPIPVAAPSMSVKLTFAGGDSWSVKAVNLEMVGLGNGP